jgi:hypothetical protein
MIKTIDIGGGEEIISVDILIGGNPVHIYTI